MTSFLNLPEMTVPTQKRNVLFSQVKSCFYVLKIPEMASIPCYEYNVLMIQAVKTYSRSPDLEQHLRTVSPACSSSKPFISQRGDPNTRRTTLYQQSA